MEKLFLEWKEGKAAGTIHEDFEAWLIKQLTQ